MKKIFILLFVICATNCFAQKSVSTYHSNYFDKDYDISVTTEKDKPNEIKGLYIDVQGETENDFVTLNYEDPELLISSLKEVRKKYAEWTKIAQDNHITEMAKEVPVDMPKLTVCWYGMKWYFAFDQKINFNFLILDNGKKVISMHGNVSASSNNYIEQEFYWVFQSVSELDGFIKKIDLSNLSAQLNLKNNKSDLFQ